MSLDLGMGYAQLEMLANVCSPSQCSTAAHRRRRQRSICSDAPFLCTRGCEDYLANRSVEQPDDTLIAQQTFADELRAALQRLSDDVLARALMTTHALRSEADVLVDDFNSSTAIATQLSALQSPNEDSPSLIHQPRYQNMAHNETQVDSTTCQSVNDGSGVVHSPSTCDTIEVKILSLAPANLDGKVPTNAATIQGFCCVACNEMTAGLRAPCNHHYCEDCLTAFVKARITDFQLPVSCCGQNLVLEDMFAHLPEDTAITLQARTLEYLAPNKVYCHNSACAAFLPPAQHQDDVATCPDCKATTCVLCKTASHNGLCPEDIHAPLFFTLATEQHWRQCFVCKNYVERTSGCNHIT